MFRVDADAHIDETEETWEYMTEAERQFKPVALDPPEGVAPVRGDSRLHRFWYVDGQLLLRHWRDDKRTGTTKATRELLDVPARVRHMDEMGVDIQVIYPTYLQFHNTARPEVDLALCRSYNRWIADKTAQSNGRLRWVVVPPTLSIDKAVEELRFGKEHGACGVFKHAIDRGGRVVSDPYFFPLYEEAMRLDLPICNHSGGIASPVGPLTVASLPRAYSSGSIACFTLLATAHVPERFPTLRFGVIEAMASWVPYVIAELKAKQQFRVPSTDEERPFSLQEDFLRSNRFYVTCETSDDLPWLLKYGAEDSLMVGTDYTHSDQCGNIEAHTFIERLGEDGVIPMEVAHKILGENAR